MGEACNFLANHRVESCAVYLAISNLRVSV